MRNGWWDPLFCYLKICRNRLTIRQIFIRMCISYHDSIYYFIIYWTFHSVFTFIFWFCSSKTNNNKSCEWTVNRPIVKEQNIMEYRIHGIWRIKQKNCNHTLIGRGIRIPCIFGIFNNKNIKIFEMFSLSEFPLSRFPAIRLFISIWSIYGYGFIPPG